MQILIYELKKATENNLWFLAINIALTVPDICSALESENGQTDGDKYRNWVNKYLVHKYNGFITGDDIWKLRCASLHQGKFNHDNPRFNKVIFQVPFNGNSGGMHNNIIGGTLQLNAMIFVTDIINSYEEWLINNKENSFIQTNLEKSFSFYESKVGIFIG